MSEILPLDNNDDGEGDFAIYPRKGFSNFHSKNEIELISALESVHSKIIEILTSKLQGLDTEIHLIGSFGLDVCIFKSELDIQISSSRENFEQVKEVLSSFCQEKHREKLWGRDYALFHSEYQYPKNDKHTRTLSIDGETVPIDYVVTVKDTEKDNHYKRTRQFLEGNLDIQTLYNMLKIIYLNKTKEKYSYAKWKLWDRLERFIKDENFSGLSLEDKEALVEAIEGEKL